MARFNRGMVVTESLTDEQVRLKVAVRDTGIGIPVEKREHVFDAFSQADTSTSRKFGGTGLGLTISKRLIEIMGGEIDVESEYGKGTTFWFSVRLLRADELQVAERREVDEELVGLRVLVVDEDRTSIQVAREMLENLGCEVHVARDGLQAGARRSHQTDRAAPHVDHLLGSGRPEPDDLLVPTPGRGFGFEQPVCHQPITRFHSISSTEAKSPALA